VAAVTRLTTDTGSESEVNLTGTLNTARMFHGTADNFLDAPSTPASRLAWVFGGYNVGGTRITSVEEWDPNAAAGQGTSTTQTAALPIALADCAAVHDPVSNKVFIFGGSTGAAAAVDTIYVWDVAGDSMSTHAATIPVALKHIAASYVPFNNRIYLFGGEDASGDMQEEVYVFNPADATTGAIVQEDTQQNLGHDEDLEVPGGESGPWVTPIGRWSATTLLEDVSDTVGAPYMSGGRLTNSVGALLNTVYRYDPPDMTIGLPRESDFGYFRFSVSSVDRQYAYKFDVTKDLAGDFFRRNDDIDFSSGAIDNDVMEYVADTGARGLRLDSTDIEGQTDIRPGDTFAGPRGSGTVDAVPIDNFPVLDEVNQWEDPNAVWAVGTNDAVSSGAGPLILRLLPDFMNQKVSVDVVEDGANVFGLVCRGTYSGAALTDGYRVIYDETATEWRIERVYQTTFQASVASGNSETYDLDAINAGASTSIDIAVDGGGAETITFASTDPLILDYTAVTALEVAAVINTQIVAAATATIAGGIVTISSDTVGPTSGIDIDAGAPNDANIAFGFPTSAVAVSPEILGTLDVGADAARQFSASARTLLVRVEDSDPVHIVVEFNSLSILDVFDLSEHRITATGKIAAEGNGQTISVFFMKTAGWREGAYSSSVAVSSVDGTTSGYTRQVSQTKDDSATEHPIGSLVGDNDDFNLRFLRNYYTLPPTAYFQYYRNRVDMTEGSLTHKEDGFRYYIRTYKHDQSHYVSGPCTVEGLFPHSFIHPETVAEDETFTYADAVNLNSFRLEFKWEPTFGHPDVQGTELELMRLEIDASNYIRLIIAAQDRDEREYNLSDIHGGHDPQFTLEKWRGGSLVDSVSVVCYYGYDNRETSMEIMSDTLVFTLDHMTGSGGYLALEIDKYKTRGRKTSTADLVAYPGNSVGDLIYNGIGWYGPPRIIVQDQSPRTNNRKLPVFRTNLHQRRRAFDAPAITVGDRDPTTGQRVQDNPYDLPEDFTRADSGHLGSDWDQIQIDNDGRNSGGGFDIVSNKAQAYGTQFERWDSLPGHRDYRFRANVKVQADADLVGLFARYPNEFFAFGGEICGYGVELVQVGTTSANVRLVAWWLSNRTVLSTSPLSAYTQGTEYRLRISCDGSTLTGEVFALGDLDTPIGTTVTTSTLFQRAGRLGIYCEAPTNFVTIDDVAAVPLFAKAFTD
jgi:hypothetical protein